MISSAAWGYMVQERRLGCVGRFAAGWRGAGVLGSTLALLGLLALAGPSHAARLALLMGNDGYRHIGPLTSARADAQAMGTALRSANYTVDVRLDLDQRQMQAAMREFKARVKEGDEVVVFYAGHAVQIEGANFLLPVDIKASTADEVRDDALQMQRILDDLAERKARFSLVIVDACRNNPFKGKGRALAGRGLGGSAPATGQMVIYSAGTDQEALDRLSDKDPVRNGVFTRVFLREMLAPGVSVRDVLQNVRQSVYEMAKSVGHDQVPAIYDQALGSFYFLPRPTGSDAAMAPPAAPSREAADVAMWSAVRESKDPAELQAYLSAYPSGRFADTARQRLEALTAAASGARRTAVPAEAGGTFKECDVCPEMVVVPQGPLVLASAARQQMGIAADAVIAAVAVGRHEVTFDEWDACVADRGCSHRPNDEGWGRGRRPVVNVSVRDAAEYAAWLSRKTKATYRLLSDAEWHYAASAGRPTRYPWGEDMAAGHAHCDGCGSPPGERRRTLPVGQFGANRFGLADMIGNAWELVADCFGPSMKTPQAAATGGECASVVARGGSFSTPAAEASLLRRREVAADVRSSQNGFRVARSLP